VSSRRLVGFGVAGVAVVLATLAATGTFSGRDAASSIGTALSDKGWGFSKGWHISYPRGSSFYVSTPPVGNLSDLRVQILRIEPRYTSSCRPKAMDWRAYATFYSNNPGWFPGTDVPIADLGNYGRGISISSIPLPAHARSNYWAVLHFSIPYGCTVQFLGFTFYYRTGHTTLHEFLVQQNLFQPR
jgi:hypothetical protein